MGTANKWWIAVLVFLLASLPVRAESDSFRVEARLAAAADEALLTITMQIPEGFYLYADRFQVMAAGALELTPKQSLPAHEKADTFTGEMVPVLDQSFSAEYSLAPVEGDPVVISVSYQGCNAETCFFPQKQTFRFPPEGGERAEPPVQAESAVITPPPEAAADSEWIRAAEAFAIEDARSGFISPKEFRVFLERKPGASNPGVKTQADRNVWLAVLLILAGGLALNLTPCVLPMLPVNLAIIGAGAQSGSRRRGFLLGGAYGLGIMLAYGCTGVLVVLTGATFGGLNANSWFNGIIALLFLILALAMFDVIPIDLTRFQRVGAASGGRGGLLVALGMGMVSALLAGACVAPVVIAVLIWSGRLYADGHYAGLLLPFVLGAGMALPWPFAGAGLSLLPRPGRWMVWVRNGFGVLILILAVYYGWLAYSLSGGGHSAKGEGTARADETTPESMNQRLAEGLKRAAEQGRPVLLDFGASWCKNCHAMEKTTLRDPGVLKALEEYDVIYYAAENPDHPETKTVRARFGVLGLPTYVILSPVHPAKNEPETSGP